MITVTERETRTVQNFWNNIHFHPTDAIEDAWGQKILNTIAQDGAVQTIRMYAMLEDIVTRDETGALQYDFTLNDLRLDYLISHGFTVLICYAFQPPCIAADENHLSSVSKNKTRYKGKMINTSRVKDFDAWEEICYQYTRHIVDRYGLERVKTWYLQCYNEPDILQFFMGELPNTPEAAMERLPEYLKLYRGFARAVERVSPNLRIGQCIACMLNFFEGFLKAAKEEQLKLDFICLHNYGAPPAEVTDGTKRFSAHNNYENHRAYQEIIDRYFPEKPILTDEWGAMSWGFMNCEEYPVLTFRENSVFAVYFGKMITEYIEKRVKMEKMILCLSGQHEMTVDFSGFRNFFTLHFIKKPIYNAFLLTKRLKETVLSVTGTDENLSVLPTKDVRGNYAILTAYADEYFEKPLPALNETLEIEAVRGDYHVRVWRIDETHTNPYTLFQRAGYTNDLTEEQIERLRAEGNMVPAEEYDAVFDGTARIRLTATDNALLLAELIKK